MGRPVPSCSVGSADTEFGYKKTMVVNLMKLSSRYGALIKVTNVIPPAISPHAMFRLGRDSLDAEVRRELLDRAMSGERVTRADVSEAANDVVGVIPPLVRGVIHNSIPASADLAVIGSVPWGV